MTRCFHSQALNGAGRCLPGRLRVVAAETALAHAGLLGQNRKRKLAAEVVVDPVMERAEFVLCCLQGQGGAELRLTAGTLEENDQVTGHG